MDMQIMPIIPTTDALIGEALRVVKLAGLWLWEQLVGVVCVTTYSNCIIVPFKNLGATKRLNKLTIAKSGFVWFSGGIGLGYLSVAAKDTYICTAEFYAENEQTFVRQGSTWTPTDPHIGITLPRWKVAAYHAEVLRLADMWAPQSRINIDKLEVNTSIINFLKDVVRWRDSRAWFEDRDIPYTLGIVLYGPPGSGKSTLAETIADLLGRRLTQIPLMDDTSFTITVAACETRAYTNVWLMEDFDATFNKRKNINPHSTISFERVLNSLSGIDYCKGRVVIITTNHPETLDPALAHIPTDGSSPVPRPGRVDHIVYVGPLDKEARERVVARVFPDRPDLWHDLVVAGEGETIALFQARCVTLALELKAKENT